MNISLAAEPVIRFGFLTVTNSLLASLLTSVILISVAFFIHFNIKKIPDSLQNIFEIAISYMDDMITGLGGGSVRRYLSLGLTLFFFILFSNWIGLLPGFGSLGIYEIKEGHTVLVPILRGAAADLNTTLALALISFFVIQYNGFQTQNIGYLKKFFNFESPILLFAGILELISEFSKIISFTFRLFGNIFAGEVLLAVVTYLVPIIVPLPFMGLEYFVGLIQAFVFSMLTLTFISMSSHGHGEEHNNHDTLNLGGEVEYGS